ncbi:hypothetical protein [Candidatus Thiosymbion oneisti]|uniref:hypothetical protein n=1 Tax=Candidatus Thiosymbion oneisti TaxID=589554 RepID=UPI000A7BDB29|nr:hypothetical protein [Candidatus Thiosymbion oneisti]
MLHQISNGTRRDIKGKPRVYYDGYWIKYYEPPADNLEAKKQLIHALTRRLFNHVEHGINIPGIRLNEARQAYEREMDPERKRVAGAMLAGALFNRATDIFTKVVELQEFGVEITSDDALMDQCGKYLLEALELGRLVRHRSGDEGLDELWGEPFRAFSIPVRDFYESRYLKIAQTMCHIDRIADVMVDTCADEGSFPGVDLHIRELADAAKEKCETLRTDPAIFEVWPTFVVAGERLCRLEPQLPQHASEERIRRTRRARALIRDGVSLIRHIARARVPMPKSTREYLEQCHHFRLAAEQGPHPAHCLSEVSIAAATSHILCQQ